MQLAIGYQLAGEGQESILELVSDYRPHIGEVYFPWVGTASGRAALDVTRGVTDWDAQRRLEDDLVELRKMGVRLDLLFNANCNGGYAASEYLENRVGSILTHLTDVLGGDGVDVVTTTSPAIAHTVKTYFPRTEVRASVNMRIGTTQGLTYSACYFDSYCLQRDRQRNLDYLRKMKRRADQLGKSLVLLANSGCFRFCPGQTFHDNLVAHEQEADEIARIKDWMPHTCWNHLKERDHWPAILQATWIRPEDIAAYAEIVPTIKLATRMHQNPRMVIAAYINGRHDGNLVDLLEPAHGAAIAPYVIDNTRFPADWLARTSTCDGECPDCGYCQGVLENVLVRCDF